MSGKTYEIPALADVVKALGLDVEVSGGPREVAESEGVRLEMRRSGWSAWGRSFNRLTLVLSVGSFRATRRSVILYKGMSISDTDAVVMRALTGDETAKVKDKYDELVVVAKKAAEADARRTAEQDREATRKVEIAKALPTHFDLESGYVQNRWAKTPVKVDLYKDTLSVRFGKDMPPEELKRLVARMTEVATEFGITE